MKMEMTEIENRRTLSGGTDFRAAPKSSPNESLNLTAQHEERTENCRGLTGRGQMNIRMSASRQGKARYFASADA